jgi:DNA-binding XRE family transcriptional regulator
MKKTRQKNRLAMYRRRMGFSQRQVAHLLGHTRRGLISAYERGSVLPTLVLALRLEIILRTPVAFLFPDLHNHLKVQIRAAEECMAGRTDRPSLLESETGGRL